MKTIGAKELRQNLEQVLDRVLQGEDMIVQHRFKQPVRLSAVQKTAGTQQKLAGLKAFDEAEKKPSPFNPNQPIKELYNESIRRKHQG